MSPLKTIKNKSEIKLFVKVFMTLVLWMFMKPGQQKNGILPARVADFRECLGSTRGSLWNRGIYFYLLHRVISHHEVILTLHTQFIKIIPEKVKCTNRPLWLIIILANVYFHRDQIDKIKEKKNIVKIQ